MTPPPQPQRPAPRTPLVIRLYVWALVVAAVGLAAYRVI